MPERSSGGEKTHPPADVQRRARPRPPTAAEKLGVKAGDPPKLPVVLKDLEAHPAELKLAQRLYLLRIRGRMSYADIAEKAAAFNTSRKRGKLSVGTVWNYVKAYARVAGKYADEDPVRDEIRFCEEEIGRLVRKRERTRILADDVKLTREIREYADMIQALKGVKQPTGPAVVVQQTAVQGGITFEQAMRGFRALDQADAGEAKPA